MPAWRYYLSIVVPLIGPMIMTAVVLLSISVIKLYDLVVAMTRGGPGIASDVPAKFVMDHLFERNNVGLATAAATMMLVTVCRRARPWVYVQICPRPAGAGHEGAGAVTGDARTA